MNFIQNANYPLRLVNFWRAFCSWILLIMHNNLWYQKKRGHHLFSEVIEHFTIKLTEDFLIDSRQCKVWVNYVTRLVCAQSSALGFLLAQKHFTNPLVAVPSAVSVVCMAVGLCTHTFSIYMFLCNNCCLVCSCCNSFGCSLVDTMFHSLVEVL